MKHKMSEHIILSTSAIFQSGFHQQEVCVCKKAKKGKFSQVEFAGILNIVIANSLSLIDVCFESDLFCQTQR